MVESPVRHLTFAATPKASLMGVGFDIDGTLMVSVIDFPAMYHTMLLSAPATPPAALTSSTTLRLGLSLSSSAHMRLSPISSVKASITSKSLLWTFVDFWIQRRLVKGVKLDEMANLFPIYASRFPSPYGDATSGSRSLSRSCSRSPDFSDVENPENNLYVRGLSSHVTKDELEKYFATEGKVIDVCLVVDPWLRESLGFGFVTME
ncbi:serine/arginine-rich splicing factor SR45a-like [Dioscorea cayenensis subsp. rotundata]|uniref:Serine/arginine-rich splicing factor SR45a-like n=1 Tax=Dioscorea cayennensis subsp. rotundata TaxID=55577 RepID=A0AB40CK18_DIOCR|nr:serine/arginine-rich splicing factor SR45a-like [Dioscorea cayenensis subsp. rotundata]XP_039139095.1 serine/arginine-rich splicing factor SR45a-like [Dioscorea cayenensis subsp. rotundata]XP_039139096.1 serine/arginine-rich splicing factor SR45a-like [Dioscorea cayenensis subsp. rotundata]XP_039139097.1 serine/arginine-rich splicing factor SR45a-like [Dioscorea cayenensis subsp. rotundata]XP_039139098.1 serine/arginine-rich splicing factor SR45a-like [Dioscorea cayenensis subsp. rotundata]